MNIGNKIRQIRELKNLSQEYVAQKTGISQSSYSRIEHDAVNINIDRLQKIANAFGVDISAIFNFSSEKFLLKK